MSTRAAAFVAVVMVTGCRGNAEYRCDTVGHSCGAGTCETSTGFCSIPDSTCPSGRRYDGTLAGDLSGQCVDGTQLTDAGMTPDGPPSDAQLFCYGTAPISICFAAPPAGAKTYSGPVDTTNAPACATNVVSSTGNFCVLAGGTITVDATLRATGPKPLVLLATDSITTGGTIDVGSRGGGATPERGAGADPADCTAMAGTAPTGGGGGAGGSFVGRGGAGAVSANGGSTAGASGPAATTITLRGGCPGQDGEGANKGVGGHGGGAVLLIATNSITIGADIIAGGAGGDAGAMATSGGGGGGAGGMIWLDAPAVTNTGNHNIIANGGAGGEGSGQNLPGHPGADATTVNAAQGGSGGVQNGGDGGDGSAGPSATALGMPGSPGNNNPANGGGGAGGGGAGLVKARSGENLGNKVSPPMTAQ